MFWTGFFAHFSRVYEYNTYDHNLRTESTTKNFLSFHSSISQIQRTTNNETAIHPYAPMKLFTRSASFSVRSSTKQQNRSDGRRGRLSLFRHASSSKLDEGYSSLLNEDDDDLSETESETFSETLSEVEEQQQRQQQEPPTSRRVRFQETTVVYSSPFTIAKGEEEHAQQQQNDQSPYTLSKSECWYDMMQIEQFRQNTKRQACRLAKSAAFGEWRQELLKVVMAAAAAKQGGTKSKTITITPTVRSNPSWAGLELLAMPDFAAFHEGQMCLQYQAIAAMQCHEQSLNDSAWTVADVRRVCRQASFASRTLARYLAQEQCQ